MTRARLSRRDMIKGSTALAATVFAPGRRKLSDIKLMQEGPAAMEAMSEEIKTRYAKLFRV